MNRSYMPIPDAEWPAEIADLKDSFAGRLNVYRVMAHHPDLLRAWVPLRRHVVQNSTLGEERLEVAILRTAHRLNSPYEWTHHIHRGRAAGLSDARIFAMRGAVDDMEPEDAVIARAVDELVDAARLSAGTREAVERLVGAHGLFDLIATVGFYTTLGCMLNTFDTPLDDGVAPA